MTRKCDPGKLAMAKSGLTQWLSTVRRAIFGVDGPDLYLQADDWLDHSLTVEQPSAAKPDPWSSKIATSFDAWPLLAASPVRTR